MQITDLDLMELMIELKKLKDQRPTGRIVIDIDRGEFSLPELVESKTERQVA